MPNEKFLIKIPKEKGTTKIYLMKNIQLKTLIKMPYEKRHTISAL